MFAARMLIKKLCGNVELTFIFVYCSQTEPMNIKLRISVASRMPFCNHVPVCTCVITQKFKLLALLLIGECIKRLEYLFKRYRLSPNNS